MVVLCTTRCFPLMERKICEYCKFSLVVWQCHMKLYIYTWSSEGWARLVIWKSELFRWYIRVLQRDKTDGMNIYYKEDL